MRITRAVVPSLFTVLNLLCGFLSILQSARDEFIIASWLIIAAAVCDVLDGFMARLTKSYSDFGVEFDSLSDVVSFGVAPAFLVYKIHLYSYGGLGILVSALLIVFGAMRLARFNIQLVGYNKDFFKGLPIPTQAIIIASFIISFASSNQNLSEFYGYILILLVVLLSFLMISTFKYDTLPKLSRRGITQHPLRFTISVIGVTAIIITKGDALFPFFLFYAATGPARYVIQFISRQFKTGKKIAEENETEISSIDM